MANCNHCSARSDKRKKSSQGLPWDVEVGSPPAFKQYIQAWELLPSTPPCTTYFDPVIRQTSRHVPGCPTFTNNPGWEQLLANVRAKFRAPVTPSLSPMEAPLSSRLSPPAAGASLEDPVSLQTSPRLTPKWEAIPEQRPTGTSGSKG